MRYRLQRVANRLRDWDRDGDLVARGLVRRHAQDVAVNVRPCQPGDVAVPLASVAHDRAYLEPLLSYAPGGL